VSVSHVIAINVDPKVVIDVQKVGGVCPGSTAYVKDAPYVCHVVPGEDRGQLLLSEGSLPHTIDGWLSQQASDHVSLW
jgi:hypothetical protein